MVDAAPNNERLDERTAKRRRQNVQRVLRSRARRLDGGVVFRMEIDGKDINALVATGALTENQRQDQNAVIKLSEEGYRARSRDKRTDTRDAGPLICCWLMPQCGPSS